VGSRIVFSYIQLVIQVSDALVLTLRCETISFVFQALLVITEMSAVFTSYIVQVIPIYFAWIL
jgi:predicted ABC-type transport system involved in lysophospholipase L1 biosynthesis ATPase subunit